MENTEIKLPRAIEDESETLNNSKQLKRWILTINNPIFTDSGYTEISPHDTDIEVLENHYDLSVLQEDENKDFFEFRYIQFEKDGKLGFAAIFSLFISSCLLRTAILSFSCRINSTYFPLSPSVVIMC